MGRLSGFRYREIDPDERALQQSRLCKAFEVTFIRQRLPLPFGALAAAER